jgi:hypothetical protein
VIEVHVVFLDNGKMYTAGEDIVILKSSFQSEVEVPLVRTTLRTETEPERGVLEAFETFLVDDATAPIIVLPEYLGADLSTCGVFMPTVSDLTEQFHGIAIVQLPLIAERGIDGAVEQEAAIEGEELITITCPGRYHGYQAYRYHECLFHLFSL